MKQPLTSDLANDEDADSILALIRLEWPDDILATRTDFEWWYHQNPAGRAVIPVIRDVTGKVVGCIWINPQQLRINSHDCLAAVGANLIIHPDYRDALNYIKLMRRFKQSLTDHKIPLHFSFISEENYQHLQQSDPNTTWTVPVLFCPLDLKSLLQHYRVSKWLRYALDPLAQSMATFYFRRYSVNINQAIEVRVVDKFDDKFNEFWSLVQDKYPIMAIRSQAYLNWRFTSAQRRNYRVLTAWVKDKMMGYVVLRTTTVRGIKTGLVMDLLVTGDDLGKTAGAYLMVQAEQYFRRQGMWGISGLMSSFTVEYQILRRAGYQPAPPFLAPRLFRFAYYAHHPYANDLGPLSPEQWFITLADHESF